MEKYRGFKLAVLILAWNRPKLWPRSMRSVLNQTVPVELVIVDDGKEVSAEPFARQLAEEFGEDRVTYVKTTGNEGPPAAQNLGRKSTDADFFAVLCDDDEYVPDAVEKMVAPLIENEDVDVVVGNVHGIHYAANGDIVRDNVYCPTDFPGTIPDMVKNILLCRTKMEAYMLRREAVEAIGGNDTDLFATDTLDVALRLCLAGGKGYHVDHIMTHKYCQLDAAHAGSIDKKIESRQKFLEKHRAVFDRYSPEILAKYYYELASLQRVYGDLKGARKDFLNAWLQNKKNLRPLIRGLVLFLGMRAYLLCKRLFLMFADKSKFSEQIQQKA